MRVIVTGGQGFISGHLVETLLGQGHAVTSLDALTYAADPDRNAGRTGFALMVGDVAKHDAGLADRIGKADLIYHLAAASHVDSSIEGQAAQFADTNVRGTVHMLDLARRIGCRFVMVSTDEVTGDRDGKDSADEQSHICASSPYSASKAAGELLTRAYVRTYGLDAVIVRPCNVMGSRQHPEKLVPRMITYGLADRPLPVYGDGRQLRQWLHVQDCVAGIIAAAERGAPGRVYCLAPQDERENREIVDVIARATRAIVERVADRPGHDRRYAQRADRARTELGWQPEILFDRTLAETIAWYKSDEGRAWTKRAIERGGRW